MPSGKPPMAASTKTKMINIFPRLTNPNTLHMLLEILKPFRGKHYPAPLSTSQPWDIGTLMGDLGGVGP